MADVFPSDPALVASAFRARIRSALLDWYDTHARDLPWRVGPAARRAGVQPDPYRVWLSEIMLQQTTVPHATPYFEAFTQRWPTVSALAETEDGELMAAWAGLGYYARARNLLACARAVAARGGVFPDTEAGLRALPGLGAYTAAAVAAIAFDEAATVMDGNVERVMARLFAVDAPLPGGRKMLRAWAEALTGADRPGDWAQALMDLGSGVCRPRNPECGACPLQPHCQAKARGEAATYPRKTPKAARPERVGQVWVLVREGAGGAQIWCERRPETGLLGGMLGLPGTDWTEGALAEGADLRANLPEGLTRIQGEQAGQVVHVFTHFRLTLTVEVVRVPAAFRPNSGEWLSADTLKALPTVFRKAAIRGLEALDPVEPRLL